MTPTNLGHSPTASQTRRSFLVQTVVCSAALGCSRPWLRRTGHSPAVPVRFGLLTDVHYADRPPAGTRHYRASLPKMREAIHFFNETRPDFIIQLGDLIDAADDPEAELNHLRTIEAEYARFDGSRHYVLGNHCVWTLTKNQFLQNSGAHAPFYSFDQGGIHFVVLDACYRADGVSYGARNFEWNDAEIPPHERSWLEADLEATELPVILFIHQRLDIPPPYGIQSHELVRQILAESGKVLAVFQGHNHKNQHQVIDGIHYWTLQAVVEGAGLASSGYSIVSATRKSIRIDGFHRHLDYPSSQTAGETVGLRRKIPEHQTPPVV